MGVATYQEGDFQDVLDALSSGESTIHGGLEMASNQFHVRKS